MSYVDVQIPEKLQTKVLDILKKVVEKNGDLKKGMNETTKAIERGKAKLVVIAGDISPAEIVMHLPAISKEKKVPYVFIDKRTDLGKAVGLTIPCSSLAVVDLGSKALSTDLDAIVKDVSALRK
jgi:large subunit ribosomal protein L7Ae